MTPVSQNEAAAQSSSGNTLTVEGKQFGRGNKTLFPNFQMPLPPEWRGATITLRTLLDGIVRAQVTAFRERQESRTVLQALSAAQIAHGVVKGKIDSGGTPGAVQDVNPDEAVQTALQAFADGLFFVFVNEDQKSSLDDAFVVGTETRVTFLRLVAMAGG